MDVHIYQSTCFQNVATNQYIDYVWNDLLLKLTYGFKSEGIVVFTVFIKIKVSILHAILNFPSLKISEIVYILSRKLFTKAQNNT